MPLFGRRLFHLNEDDLKEDNEQEQVYTIDYTGEKFHSIKLYEKLKKVYELERWTCQCTWRAGLRHKEAYQSEIETRKLLPTLVPTYFNKPMFDIIHHNVKTLEKLAEEISIILSQAFVIGEPVQFKKRKDTTVVKGTVERVEDNDDQRKRTSERASVQAKIQSDKQMKNVKYAIRLSDEDRVISNIQPNELQRSSMLPNREKLKTFIRSYAIRLGNRADSPWIFYDDSIKEKFHIKDRLSPAIIEKFQKSMTITLDEILREQERILRKQAEEQAALLGENKKTNEDNNHTSSQNGHSDDIQIILSDDEAKAKSPKKKVKSTPTTPNKSTPTTSKKSSQQSPTKKSRSSPTKQKSATKSKKQLTLHDMKFAKNANSNNQLLQKTTSSSSTSVPTYNIAVPYSLLQKLDKTRRDRGIQSRLFQRLILHCARTLNDKQRLRLPDEYRSLIQIKYEELELKRRLSEMTEQEKKLFLQTKQKQKQLEQKSSEDLDLTSSKILPLPKQIESLVTIPSHYVGDLLVICTFFTSCHSLFLSSLTDHLSKTAQLFLRSFKHEYLIQAYTTSSTTIFFNYFIELLQILMKLLFKEDENRSNNEEINNDDDDKLPQQLNNNNNDQQDMDINHIEQISVDDDIEQTYDMKLVDIPLTPFTCQELTRLYLLREKDENKRNILDRLANCETKEFSIPDQIDLLLLLVNIITIDSELMSDYFEYLTRTTSEISRERNQLLAERRKAQEEESKQKKLQLQNGENDKVSSKKPNKTGSLLPSKNSTGITNDENHESSSTHQDDNGDIDSDGDDDLKSVIQRRRQMVAMSKELKEKRDLEAQKLHNEQKRELAIQRIEQAYQEALINLQFGFRIKPLGFDRNYNRYWFFKGHAGLFVERGWIGSDINYSAQSSSSQDLSLSRSSSIINGEKLIPKDELNQWWIYDNEIIIEQLIQSLNERGIRENNLLINIKKIMPTLHTEFEQIKNKNKNSIEPQQQQQDESLSNTETSNDQQQSNDIITSFKNDLEDIESRLRLGSLGGFIINDNLTEWQTKLKQSHERFDLAELLIQLQQTVVDKYASGIFGTLENQSKNSKNSSRKKSSIIKSSTNPHNLQIWMNDCRTCKTFSRLYVLMMIFENCIAWNKSTLGLKCKICRKKNKDEYIIVCDQCCQGYHLECLRSFALNNTKNSTNDLWYCPVCRPQSISKRRGGKQQTEKSKNDYYDADIYDMDVDITSNTSSHERLLNDNNNQDLSDLNSEENSDDELEDLNESNEDNLCSVCSGETSNDNELIQCIQCRSLFHCQCHEPPLRCPPRSTTWMCNSCRNGVNNETIKPTRRIQTRRQMTMKKQEQKYRKQPQRQNGTRRTTRKNYREIEEDDDEEEEEEEVEEEATTEESDYEQETRNQRRSKRLRRSSPYSTTDTADKFEDNHDNQRTRRRVRIEKSTSSSSPSPSDEEEILKNINDEESDMEQDEDDDEEEQEENGNTEATSPSSQ